MRKSSVCERITYRETWDVQDTRMNDYNPCLDSSDVLGIDRFLFLCKEPKEKGILTGQKTTLSKQSVNYTSVSHYFHLPPLFKFYQGILK